MKKAAFVIYESDAGEVQVKGGFNPELKPDEPSACGSLVMLALKAVSEALNGLETQESANETDG